MKKLVGLMMVLGLVLGLGSGAMAADSNTVTVTANVTGTCRFSSPTSTLAFGALDPGSGNPASAATTTNFWCTNGTAYTITDNDGLYFTGPNANRMRHATTLTQFIPYTFSYNPASGNGSGPGTPITLTISGSILFASYQNADPGDYSDTVVLSITP
jgi:spore coat protein U-like protein